MIRSIKSVETSLVLRLRIAVIRERDVRASLAAWSCVSPLLRTASGLQRASGRKKRKQKKRDKSLNKNEILFVFGHDGSADPFRAQSNEVWRKQMIDETYALDCMRSRVEFSRYN